jgi:c-di-GMP-binding flagellar brake protein YcgR
MTQLAQLSEEEFEERFQITGQRPVQFLLAGLAEHNEAFNVHFDHGREHFITMLLAAPPESGKLIFDCSGSSEINRRLLGSDHNVFSGRPGGIQVQFTSGRVSEIIYAGARAFSVGLPKMVLRLQRRESFRIETLRTRPLIFRCTLQDGQRLELPAHDISCAGIGLTASSLPDNLSLGMHLANTFFALPEEKKDFLVGGSLRHITEQETHTGRQWRIGLEFDKLPYAEESRIQRYIAKVEHERHEMS